MNLLVLTQVYPQPDDGTISATNTVKYFCEEWARQGHRVFVIHNSSKFPRLYYFIPSIGRDKISAKLGFELPTYKSTKVLVREENEVKIYRFPLAKIIPHTRFKSDQIDDQVSRIVRVLENNSFYPDLILSHWLNPQLDIVEKLKAIYPVRTSIVFHNDCTKKNVETYQLDVRHKVFDAIGCRSLPMANDVKRKLGLKKLPFVCYSGIPDAIASKYENGLPKKKINSFVYVGRLVNYKKADTILYALDKAFPKHDFIFNIVGSGGFEEKLRAISKQLNLEKQVVFHGQLSRERAMELMAESECFTMISENETFGMVYIEAMAMGCLTIASLGGGVEGIIQHGHNGYLCKPGNVDNLASLYKELAQMSENEKSIIQVNAIKTATQFADSKLAKRYLMDVLTW